MQLTARSNNDHPETCRCSECRVDLLDVADIVETTGTADPSTELKFEWDEPESPEQIDKGEPVPLFRDEPPPVSPVYPEAELLWLPAEAERFLDANSPMWRHAGSSPRLVITRWGTYYSETDLREWIKQTFPDPFADAQ